MNSANDHPEPEHENIKIEVSGVETYNPLPANAPPEEQIEYRWYMEQAVLLLSALKWTALAGAVGIVAGLGVKIYLFLLRSTSLKTISIGHFALPAYWLLPLSLPLCVLIVKTFARGETGETMEGTDEVITAIHNESGRIKSLQIPIRLLANIITLATGGSVGKEGPAAQIGAAVASVLASVIQLTDDDRRRLVICGVGAGFAAVFGTPVSGALFGVEVLYMGKLEYPVLFPCIVAGLVAHLACGVSPPGEGVQHISISQPELVLISLISGLAFGLIALLLIETMRLTDSLLVRFRGNPYLVAAAGGFSLALLYLMSSGSYMGLGQPVINAALQGTAVISLAAFLVKIFATSISLKTGGVGGIMTPIFFIGSTSGAALATMFHQPPALLARFGFVAMVAAAANTPIAAIVMALELMGGHLGVYAALSACAAYLIVGHRSVFAAQRLGYSKSAGLLPTLDIPMGDVYASEQKLRAGNLLETFVEYLKRR